MKKEMSPIAMAANGMPIPMPIFAPLDNPFRLGVVVEELVDVGVGCVGVVDGCIAEDEVDELLVVVASTSKSELCHHTGMPSPYMVKVDVLATTVVVLGILASVENQVLSFRNGLM